MTVTRTAYAALAMTMLLATGACTADPEPARVSSDQSAMTDLIEKAPTGPGVEDEDMSAIYGAFLESENIDLPESDARRIARAACEVLRKQTYPSDPDFDYVAIGVISGARDEYPSLSRDEAATIIGAGITVYCPEMEGGL